MRVVCVAIALCVAGCALDDRLPPSPTAAARADGDRAAARLRDHLRGLPGVVDAAVTVALPVDDPLAPPHPTTPPRAALALTIEADAPPAPLRAAAEAAAHAALGPRAEVAIDLLPLPAPPARPDRTRAIAIALALAVAAAAVAVALALARIRAQRRRGARA